MNLSYLVEVQHVKDACTRDILFQKTGNKDYRGHVKIVQESKVDNLTIKKNKGWNGWKHIKYINFFESIMILIKKKITG